jgi:protein gp37
MGDLFGEWVDAENHLIFWADGDETLLDCVHSIIKSRPQHNFLFLTKCGWNLKKWGKFPDNAWVGVTAWDRNSFIQATVSLRDVEAKHKWISIEPFLGAIIADVRDSSGITIRAVAEEFRTYGIEWVVIGAQQRPTIYPKLEDLKTVVEAADKAGVKVFLKDNLKPIIESSLPDGRPCLPSYTQQVDLDGDFYWAYRQEVPWEVKSTILEA